MWSERDKERLHLLDLVTPSSTTLRPPHTFNSVRAPDSMCGLPNSNLLHFLTISAQVRKWFQFSYLGPRGLWCKIIHCYIRIYISFYNVAKLNLYMNLKNKHRKMVDILPEYTRATQISCFHKDLQATNEGDWRPYLSLGPIEEYFIVLLKFNWQCMYGLSKKDLQNQIDSVDRPAKDLPWIETSITDALLIATCYMHIICLEYMSFKICKNTY